MKKIRLIPRDISWLSFNGRVLQEAADPSVALKNRVHFLAIHSANLDEFFSTRVPALKAEMKLERKKHNYKQAKNIKKLLDQIHDIVIQQQTKFTEIWTEILKELNKAKIFLRNEKELTKKQETYIKKFYDKKVSTNIIPLFIQSVPASKPLWAKNLFLGVVMRTKNKSQKERYAIIEIPTKAVNRFVQLPTNNKKEQDIILLEDVIRFHLPYIFSYFGYDSFDAHLFKVAQNAEIDFDANLSGDYVEKITRGVKSRRKAKPIYFLYDKDMDLGLFNYLVRWLRITKKDSIVPRGRIRNFSDFNNFPAKLPDSKVDYKPFPHPDLKNSLSISEALFKKDILLCTPYHSFNPLIDLLREAAMDPQVTSIHITAYRLAKYSKICNALINAARNGKKVNVVIELKAQFDEAANLEWKNRLEDEGVNVFVGFSDLKIHAKMCVIRKKVQDQIKMYGFIGTGNLNENTAIVYADYYLLTSNQEIMRGVQRIFQAIEKKHLYKKGLKNCKPLVVSPTKMRKTFVSFIEREINNKLNSKKCGIKIVTNSLNDEIIIRKLYKAAKVGVPIEMIVRSIMGAIPNQKKFKIPLKVTSIVDHYLEHGRIWLFNNNGKNEMYITSSDLMGRNLDQRVEVAVPIFDKNIKKQLLNILYIKLHDNVKARILDNNLSNLYVKKVGKKVRSQIEIYKYLHKLSKRK